MKFKMQIAQITFIVTYEFVKPLLFAAFEAEIDCFSKIISSLDSFGHLSDAFVAHITLTFIFRIISPGDLATRTNDQLLTPWNLALILLGIWI